MKDIVFEQPVVKADFKTDTIYTHKFKGYNISNQVIKKLSAKGSCACLTATLPDEILPNSSFELSVHINKLGQQGYYSNALYLEFSNGQKETLKISGQLILN